jgi:hypothetical protein
MLGRIIAGTNEQLFGPALVLLRIAFGAILVMSYHTTFLFWLEPFALVIGVLFIAGLLVRPASLVVLLALIVLDIMLMPLPMLKMLIWPQLIVVSVALMGLAGGLGNAFGLNGLILRNIKNPSAVVKFLFS